MPAIQTPSEIGRYYQVTGQRDACGVNPISMEAFEPVRFAPAPVDFDLKNTIRSEDATVTIEQVP